VTLAGGPMSAQYARAMLARTAARAGIERRVVPHQLRHTHAAEFAEGVPMPVIRDQLGHSSLAVTDRYLRNVAPAEVIAIMQRRRWVEPTSHGPRLLGGSGWTAVRAADRVRRPDAQR
jgi:integrase